MTKKLPLWVEDLLDESMPSYNKGTVFNSTGKKIDVNNLHRHDKKVIEARRRQRKAAKQQKKRNRK